MARKHNWETFHMAFVSKLGDARTFFLLSPFLISQGWAMAIAKGIAGMKPKSEWSEYLTAL